MLTTTTETSRHVVTRAEPQPRKLNQKPDPANSPAGKCRFAAWEPTRVIARSGRFELYRARIAGELGPGCYVCKTPRRAGQAALALAQLLRESAVAAAVSHPGVISVLASAVDEQHPQIVLPYLDGVSVRRAIDSLAVVHHCAPQRRWPIVTALGVIRQVAAALVAFHEAGWLHGQVAPGHILVSPEGHATLIDLAHSRRMDSAETRAPELCIANLRYAAPEQFGATQLTSASDIYSLGITLFEMIAGQPPFADSSPGELARAHRTRRIPDIYEFRPECAADIAQLLSRLLAKEPLRRPTAEQTVRWLTELEIDELAGGA